MAGALRRRRSPPETLPLEGTYTDNLTDPDFGFSTAFQLEHRGPIVVFSDKTRSILCTWAPLRRFLPSSMGHKQRLGKRGNIIAGYIWNTISLLTCVNVSYSRHRGQKFRKKFLHSPGEVCNIPTRAVERNGNDSNNQTKWAVSSGGEHYLDTVGVTSSNLVSPTTSRTWLSW